MLKRCACVSKQQDELHGKGMRTHNPCKLPAGQTGWRCTVCCDVKGKGGRKP